GSRISATISRIRRSVAATTVTGGSFRAYCLANARRCRLTKLSPPFEAVSRITGAICSRRYVTGHPTHHDSGSPAMAAEHLPFELISHPPADPTAHRA